MHLHCNKCYCIRKGDLEKKFYLTSCRHVICAQCLQEKCPICGHKCKTALIARNMPSAASTFFVHPKKQFEQFQNTIKFWQAQEASLCTYTLNHLPKKMRLLVKRCKGMQELDARLREQIENEKQRIEKLKSFINYSEQKDSPHFSPRSRPDTPSMSSFDTSSTSNEQNIKVRGTYENKDTTLDSFDPGNKRHNFFL